MACHRPRESSMLGWSSACPPLRPRDRLVRQQLDRSPGRALRCPPSRGHRTRASHSGRHRPSSPAARPHPAFGPSLAPAADRAQRGWGSPGDGGPTLPRGRRSRSRHHRGHLAGALAPARPSPRPIRPAHRSHGPRLRRTPVPSRTDPPRCGAPRRSCRESRKRPTAPRGERNIGTGEAISVRLEAARPLALESPSETGA